MELDHNKRGINFMSLLKSAKIPVGATFIALMSFVTTTKAGNAAIVGVPDSGSDISPGSNTISNLGYQMVAVTDSTASDRSSVTSLASPDGDLITTPLEKRTVPTSFSYWSHNYTGPVYLSSSSSDTINLPDGIQAFDLYIEPNNLGKFDITASGADNTTSSSTTQSVAGFNGAEYFGFYSNGADEIKTVTITTPTASTNSLTVPTNFAIGELRVSTPTVAVVPEPSSLLGTLAFGTLGTVYLLKRQLK
jgi:hypothetical protein